MAEVQPLVRHKKKRERSSSIDASAASPASPFKRESSRIAQWFLHWASSRDYAASWARTIRAQRSEPALSLAATAAPPPQFSSEDAETLSEPAARRSTDESVSRLLRCWLSSKPRIAVAVAGSRGSGKRALVNTLLRASHAAVVGSPRSKPRRFPTHGSSSSSTVTAATATVAETSTCESFRATSKWAATAVDADAEARATPDDDEHSFILPQGTGASAGAVVEGLPHVCRVQFGRIAEGVVSFIGETDLREALWEWFQCLTGAHSVDPERSVALQQMYAAVKLPTAPAAMHGWVSPRHLPIPRHLLQLLGRSFSFRGTGRSLETDRVYVREQLRTAIACWGPLITGIEVRFPSSLLIDGNCEIVLIDSDVPFGTVVASQVRQHLRGAKLLVLTTDKRGITRDDADLLRSTSFLHGLLSQRGAKQLAVIELVQSSCSHRLLPSPSILEPSESSEERRKTARDTLARLFGELPLDHASSATKEAIFRALADTLMLSVDPMSFWRVLQNGGSETSAESQETNFPALLCSIKNRAIMACGEELCNFSESWLYRQGDGTRGPSIPSASPDPEDFTERSRSWTESMESLGSIGSGNSLDSIPQLAASSGSGSTGGGSGGGSTTFSMKLDQITESLRRYLHVTPRAKDARGGAQPSPLPTLDKLASTIKLKFLTIRKTLSETELAFKPGPGRNARRTAEIATFEEAVHASRRKAESQWPGFKEAFFSTRDACLVILNPKFEGECLGADLKQLLCQPLIDFSTAVWAGPALKALQRAEEHTAALIHEAFNACGKIADQLPVGQDERLQIRQFMWQRQESVERFVSKHFQEAHAQLETQGMGDNVEPVVSNICRNIIKSTLLSKTSPEMTIRQLHQLVERSFSSLPGKCVPAIKVHFANCMTRAMNAHLGKIEEHLLQSLSSVLTFQADGSSSAAPRFIPDVLVVSQRELQQSASPTYIAKLLSNKAPINADAPRRLEYKRALIQNGLRVVDTVLDGNSQFRSLAHLLYGTEDAHAVIRLLAVLEILHRPEEYAPFVRGLAPDLHSSIQVYSSLMSKDDVPGDHVTLLAFAAFSRIDILVYSQAFPKPMMIPSSRREKRGSLALPPHFANAIKRAASTNAGGMLLLRLSMEDTGQYRPIIMSEDAAFLAEYDEHQQSKKCAPRKQLQQLQQQQQQQPTAQFLGALQQTGAAASSVAADTENKPRTLSDLCVSQIARNICSFPAGAPQALPEDLVIRILGRVISEHTCDGVDFDIMLMRLLHIGVTTLDLSGCTYLTKYSLIEAARACPNLRTLALANCPRVSDEDIGLLSHQCKQLESVNMSRCHLVGDGALAALAVNCPDLFHLNVSGCRRVGAAGLQSLRNTKVLRFLEIAGCEEVMDAAISGLENLELFDASHCPRLTDAALATLSKGGLLRCAKFASRWMTDDGIAALVRSSPGLEVLDVSGCTQAGSKTVQEVFRSCQRIQRFLMAGCTHVADSSFPFSAPATEVQQSLPNLVVLNISGCAITDTTLGNIAALCPQLTSLNIAGCSAITDRALIQAIGRLSLTRLNVDRCTLLSDMSLCELAKTAGGRLKDVAFAHTQATNLALGALCLCCAHLKQVDCSHCLQISDEGLVRLAGCCTLLEALAVEGCSGLTDAAIGAFARQSVRLRVLKAGYLPALTDSGLESLGRCKALEVLDVSHCPRTTAGGILRLLSCAPPRLANLQARGLSPSAASAPLTFFCPALRAVSIAWSRDIDADTMALVLARGCPSLESINASRCAKLSDSAVRQLAGRCPNIRQLNLSGCPLIQPATVRFLALSGVAVSTQTPHQPILHKSTTTRRNDLE